MCDYCYCAFPAIKLYMSKTFYLNLRFPQTFKETNTPLSKYLRHQLGLNIPENHLSKYKSTNYTNRENVKYNLTNYRRKLKEKSEVENVKARNCAN